MTHETESLSVEIPFSGFYASTHNAMFDDWLEYESEYLQSEHGASESDIEKLAQLFWDCVDWRAAHVEYAKEYCEALASYVADESRQYKEDSTGKRYLSEGLKLALVFEELKSPRFYNYETDRIYCKVPTVQLEQMRREVPADFWAEYVKENCTSYDGFASSYPADASEWPSELSEWGEAGLGLLLQAFIIHNVGDAEKVSEDLRWHIMEDARGNGFIDNCIFGNASAAFVDFANSLRKE